MTHDLQAALALATNAALRAGALLRDEFGRRNGPRGTDGHAEVDSEAERLIRASLTTAYPEWGYVGEETRPPLRTGAELVWLVDPNDGTRSYLKGLRGSAVSIGLVRHGVPVLGVVYAPVAPDHGGDLFTWAEGGTLTRNGRELPGRELPSRLGPLDIVLVSQDARPKAWERFIQPK